MGMNPITHRDINQPLGDLRPSKKRGGAGSTDLVAKNHRGPNGGRGGSNVPLTDVRQYEMK